MRDGQCNIRLTQWFVDEIIKTGSLVGPLWHQPTKGLWGCSRPTAPACTLGRSFFWVGRQHRSSLSAPHTCSRSRTSIPICNPSTHCSWCQAKMTRKWMLDEALILIFRGSKNYITNMCTSSLCSSGASSFTLRPIENPSFVLPTCPSALSESRSRTTPMAQKRKSGAGRARNKKVSRRG